MKKRRTTIYLSEQSETIINNILAAALNQKIKMSRTDIINAAIGKFVEDVSRDKQ